MGVSDVRKAELEPVCDEEAIRTWKRDGSQSVMSLKAAVENLASFSGITDHKSIRSMLLAGRSISTRLAIFDLKADGYAER